MQRNRHKSLPVFLVMVGFLIGLLCGLTGCGRPASGKIDQRLIGTWVKVTVNSGEALSLRTDGTFQEIFSFNIPTSRSHWYKRLAGKYRIDGEKIIFYDTKYSTSCVQGVVKYKAGAYEILDELYKQYELNDPVPDSSSMFQIIDSDTLRIDNTELKRVQAENDEDTMTNTVNDK